LKLEAGKAFPGGLKLAAAPSMVHFLPAPRPSPTAFLSLER
jgi:hypothetical protein